MRSDLFRIAVAQCLGVSPDPLPGRCVCSKDLSDGDASHFLMCTYGKSVLAHNSCSLAVQYLARAAGCHVIGECCFYHMRGAQDDRRALLKMNGLIFIISPYCSNLVAKSCPANVGSSQGYNLDG